MKAIRPYLLFGLLILPVLLTAVGPSDDKKKIAGVSLVSPPRVVNGEWTESLCKVNAGWVSVQPYAFSYPNQSEVHYNGNRQWWGERTEGAAELVRQAHQNNIKVMLKPMVWVPGGWVGSYAMKTEDAWVAWEKSYTAYILENAALAQKEGVELFCIGTEFNEAVIQRPKFWPRLVADVRKVYSGPVTYAANWDNYKLVKFWDVLDYMGVDAYFPLSPKTIPNVAELKKLWSEPAREIELMHRYYKKPVLFTEFGYRSIDACSWKHWEQEHIPNNQQVNLKAQVNAYRAFFEYYWHLDWFAGVFIWQWYTHHESAGGENNSDFTPQNKPACEEICSWFGR